MSDERRREADPWDEPEKEFPARRARETDDEPRGGVFGEDARSDDDETSGEGGTRDESVGETAGDESGTADDKDESSGGEMFPGGTKPEKAKKSAAEQLKSAASGLAVVGVVLLAFVLCTGGISAIVTPRAGTAEALYECSEHGGGVYRPFVEAEFGYVTFSGLYLTDDEDTPQVWVMWGFGEDKVTCFFVKASGEDVDGDGIFNENDAPGDEEDVRYILRAAQPSYADHSEWALDESISDTAYYYGMDEDETAELFLDGVLEASRQNRVVARAGAVAGVLALALAIVCAALAASKGKKEAESLDGREFYAAGDEDEIVPRETSDEEEAPDEKPGDGE